MSKIAKEYSSGFWGYNTPSIYHDPLVRMIIYRGQDRIDATLMKHWLRLGRIYTRFSYDTHLVRIEYKTKHQMLAFHGLKKGEIL